MDRLAAPLDQSPALAAYEHMAPHYDEFTAHHDYELWLGHLLPVLAAHGLSGDRLLDVGCGTGKSFLPMLDRGWSVVGVDISPAMLARARGKVPAAVRLENRDMRVLPTIGEFDLVWCLDDAVNYLLAVEELRAAFAGFRRNLKRGGLLAFDVNTLASYRGFFAETHYRELGDTSLVWTGEASATTAPGTEVAARFAVLTEGVTHVEIHRQRHFLPEEIDTALTAAGLRCLGVYGHGFDAVFEQPLDETRHTKAVFVATRDEGR